MPFSRSAQRGRRIFEGTPVQGIGAAPNEWNVVQALNNFWDVDLSGITTYQRLNTKSKTPPPAFFEEGTLVKVNITNKFVNADCYLSPEKALALAADLEACAHRAQANLDAIKAQGVPSPPPPWPSIQVPPNPASP